MTISYYAGDVTKSYPFDGDHDSHYVAYDWCPDGIMLFMRWESFMACSAAIMSTGFVGPSMDFESACYWYQAACNQGIVLW